MKDFPAIHKEFERAIAQLGRELPGPMSGFAQLHKAATAGGVLPAKVKELIALGTAITARCEGCIAYHVHDSLKAGASPAEVTETIGVAVMMGGGPSVIYGSEALQALHQFAPEPAAVPAD